MKWSLIGLLFLISCTAFAPKKRSDEENVQKTILRMFALVKEGKTNELASHIVYRGEDATRKWKDACRYHDTEEKDHVEQIQERIQNRYLPYSYEFVNFFSQMESEGEWLIWEMNFFMGENEPKKVYFAFLKVGGKYLLGDID